MQEPTVDTKSLSESELQGPLPLTSLDPTVKEISTILGVDPNLVYSLEKALPVQVNFNALFGSGSAGIEELEGRVICNINFRNSFMLSSGDHNDHWTRVEELTHYIHLANNPTVVNEMVENRRFRTRPLSGEGFARGSPNVLVNGANLSENVDQAIRDFGRKTHLELANGSDPEADRRVLKALVVEKKLTIEEAAKLFRALQRIEPSVWSEEFNRYLNMSEYYQKRISQLQWGVPFSEEYFKAERMKEYFTREKNSHDSLIFRALSEHLETLLKDKGSEIQAAELLALAGITRDSIRFKSQAVRGQIQGMSNYSQLETIERFLEGDVSLVEIQDIATGIGATDVAVQTFTRDPKETHLPPEKLQDLKRELLERIRTLKKTGLGPENDVGKTLQELFSSSLRQAKAQSQFALSLMLNFEDLPDDPEQRRKLLSNPEYIKMYQESMKRLIEDSLQAQAMDFARFVADPNYAKQVVSSLIPASFGKPQALELTEYVANLQLGMAEAVRGGQLPEYIERDARSDIYKKKIELRDKSPKQTEEVLDQKAKDTAIDDFTERHKILKRHDLLMEPIAKVIAAMVTGTKVEEIEYPVAMWGNYSPLLNQGSYEDVDSALRRWHVRLSEFVRHVAKSKNGWTIMKRFFGSQTLEEQQGIVLTSLGISAL